MQLTGISRFASRGDFLLWLSHFSVEQPLWRLSAVSTIESKMSFPPRRFFPQRPGLFFSRRYVSWYYLIIVTAPTNILLNDDELKKNAKRMFLLDWDANVSGWYFKLILIMHISIIYNRNTLKSDKSTIKKREKTAFWKFRVFFQESLDFKNLL